MIMLQHSSVRKSNALNIHIGLSYRATLYNTIIHLFNCFSTFIAWILNVYNFTTATITDMKSPHKANFSHSELLQLEQKR